MAGIGLHLLGRGQALVGSTALLALAANLAVAQSWILPVTPNGPGYSKRSGLRIEVEFPLGCDVGYTPVAFTVRRATATGASQAVTIRFRTNASRRRGGKIEVEEDFELPASATSTSLTMAVPLFDTWHNFEWDVWIDGRKDNALCLARGVPPQRGNSETLSVLTTPNVKIAGNFETILRESVDATINHSTQQLAELPDRWLDYSLLDLAVLSSTDLATLPEQFPHRAAALLRWVRSGGNLWILEAGDGWEDLVEIESALGIQPTGNADADDPQQRAWKYVSLGERAHQPVEALLEISDIETALEAPREKKKDEPDPPPVDLTNRVDQTAIRGGPLDLPDDRFRRRRRDFPRTGYPGIRQQRPATSERLFLVRAFGMGSVTAFPGRPTPGFGRRMLTPFAVRHSFLPQRLNWVARHGVAIDRPNADFNNWLIPGVGVAPVGGFQFLISLFVLVIGPLNYWLLSRAKKLPLLLITVPTAAATVTALLFGYGLLADGFGVQVRARSVTMLDQTTGEAASWSRLSYYASLAPKEGMTMSDQTIVYPILSAGWGSNSRRRLDQRELLWSNGEQHLTRGWLATRTPVQYLSLSARATDKRLQLKRNGAGLAVTNRLGVDLLALAVQDHQGKHYWLEELAEEALPDGQTANLPPAQYKAIAGRLRERFAENEPTFPVGGDWDTQSYGNGLDQNLLEAQLTAVVSPLARGFGNGQYIAVTDRGMELELGLAEFREKASFHVVKGQFAPLDPRSSP